MTQTTLETIEEQHRALLHKSAEMKEAGIPQVEAFVESVTEAGRYIEDPDQRSFLCALIRYWSGIMNERKRVSSSSSVVQLQPFDVSLSFGKEYLRKLVEKPSFVSIDNDRRLKNLSNGYWVYDEMLNGLASNGWVRFAPGYKGAVYGKNGSQWCIKVLGMGVGDNPLFFKERGYYLEHERKMLETFKRKGYTFQPEVMSQEETIKFLISEECGISPYQAELRTLHNDVLITQYIAGIPFATQTGHYVDYASNIDTMGEKVLGEMYTALTVLKGQLARANMQGLRHNDPVPPNIIFTLDEEDQAVAKLVDFETAQDLNVQPQESWLQDTVRDLYRDRNVPIDKYGEPVETLDQYLIDKDIAILDSFIQTVSERSHLKSVFPEKKFAIPFLETYGSLIME